MATEFALAQIVALGLQRGLSTVWANVTGTPSGPWDVTHLAWVRPGTASVDAPTGTAKPVLLVARVDPLVDGDNITWSPGTLDSLETSLVPETGLMTLLDPEHYTDWRAARDKHRIGTGTPRHVLRSDAYGQRPKYALRHPWPAGLFAQGGTTRLRLADGTYGPDGTGSGEGIFIEMAPRDPRTFMRGEAATYAEAEDLLWARWERILACPQTNGSHSYEARGYRNGLGFCRHCDLATSNAFTLAEIGSLCLVCGTPTDWSHVSRFEGTERVKGRGEHDLVCAEHAPPTYAAFDGHIWRLTDPAKHDDPDGDQEPEDVFGPAPSAEQWDAVLRYLPPGEPLDVWRRSGFDQRYYAVERGRRDLVDALINGARADRPVG